MTDTDRFPFEDSAWSSDLNQKRQWYEALERTGLINVRFRLAQHTAGSAGSLAIGNEVGITKGFVEEWSHWHDQRREHLREQSERRSLNTAKAAAWAAALSAVAAAIPPVTAGVQWLFAPHPATTQTAPAGRIDPPTPAPPAAR